MMSRRTNRPKSDLHWDGRAVWWPRYDASIPGGDAKIWMCAEDLSSEIWTHFHRLERHHGRYEVEPVRLNGCSDELRDILIDCIPYNEYREDLSGAVVQFAKMVAQQLILEGSMTFELQAGWDRSGGTPRLGQARLELIPSDSLVRAGTRALQVVPPGATGDALPGQLIRLDRSRLVLFRPPPRWRGPVRHIRSGLQLIGRSEQAWMKAASQHEAREDFKSVSRAYALQRARLTAPIGWRARGSYDEYAAAFHLVSRELRWKRFCIEIRDDILTTLGKVFALIGSWREESPRLVWEHLPTIQHVTVGEALLAGNGARFSEVLKPFGLRSVSE